MCGNKLLLARRHYSIRENGITRCERGSKQVKAMVTAELTSAKCICQVVMHIRQMKYSTTTKKFHAVFAVWDQECLSKKIHNLL